MKILTILVFCLTCLPVFSQKEKASRLCRVIFLQRTADSPSEAELFDGTVSHKIQLSSMNFSQEIELPEGDITLGMTPNPILKPEDFPAAAPKVKVPAKIRDIYLILISDPTNSVFPVKIQPVDASNDTLKLGETLWINLSTHPIEARLGEETLKVPAGSKVVGKAPLKENGYYKAQFMYQPDGKGQFQPVMRKSWWFDASSKNLGFIIDTGERVPIIFSFRDNRSETAVKSSNDNE